MIQRRNPKTTMQITKDTQIDDIIRHLTSDHSGSHTAEDVLVDQQTGTWGSEWRPATWEERVSTAQMRTGALVSAGTYAVAGTHYAPGETVEQAVRRSKGIYEYHEIEGHRAAEALQKIVDLWDAKQNRK